MIADRVNDTEHRYKDFVRCINASFHKYTDGPMFTTSAGKMFDYFLKNLPEEHRQYYNCNECRRFINKYGGLVSIGKDGKIHPVMWELYSDYPEFFLPSVEAMRQQVIHSFVTGVFYTNFTVLGTTESNGWSHFHAKVKAFSCIRPKSINTPYQQSCEKLEDYKLLSKALRTYHIDVVKRAVTLLSNDTLYRGDKVLPNAKWFKKIYMIRPSIRLSRVYKNRLWKEVAIAPDGFCHVSSNMLGTLLDDITEGMDIDKIKRRFKKKMNPNIGGYQRPSSEASNGNIDQAEKIIDKMGIRQSLERRFATLVEVPLIWAPFKKSLSDSAVMNTGVFSHLRDKKTKPITSIEGMDPVILNWRDFKEQVLPNAEKVLCYVSSRSLPLTGILTAVHPNSPPILKWDTLENRNRLSTYVYTQGSRAESWDLRSNTYVNVTGIINKPAMEERSGIIFILEGCKDTRYKESGSALFPEILKSELHSIRKTIESYSQSKSLEGFENSTACGMYFNSDSPINLKVTVDGDTVPYKIDRW